MVESGNMDACLMIAGVGGLDQQLREVATKHGIEDRMRIVGWIDDPTRLLLASDLLLMPSQEWYGEGLGLAAVEAQGCGVPVLCSLSIPEDAAIIPALFKRITLRAGASHWAKEATVLLDNGQREMACSRKILEQSAFTDAASYASLAGLYFSIAAEQPSAERIRPCGRPLPVQSTIGKEN
jgi:glycosyltransferase involved in cell wall biosynthesis